jgi:hypothetical protein
MMTEEKPASHYQRAHVGVRNESRFWDRVLRLLWNAISEAIGTLLPPFRDRVFRLWRP